MLINVLDPSKHRETITPREYEFVDGEVNLGQDVILANGVTFEGTNTYTAGIDYSLGYDEDGNAILSVLNGGKLATASKVKIGFTKLNPSAVTSYDIIGGVDASTGNYTGFELVNRVFPKFRIVPGLLGSPKWLEKLEVAAVMRAKAENINGLFTCVGECER